MISPTVPSSETDSRKGASASEVGDLITRATCDGVEGVGVLGVLILAPRSRRQRRHLLAELRRKCQPVGASSQVGMLENTWNIKPLIMIVNVTHLVPGHTVPVVHIVHFA